MFSPERKGIQAMFHDGNDKLTKFVLRPRLLSPSTMAEIIDYASANQFHPEILILGSSSRISGELLREIGELPEQEKDEKVAFIVDAISDVAACVIFNKIVGDESPERFIFKNLTAQELTPIMLTQQKNKNACVAIVYGKQPNTAYRSLDSTDIEEVISNLTANPLESLPEKIFIHRPKKT